MITRMFALLLTLTIQPLAAEDAVRKLPDIPGFQTLHCDFHMHTVFSDGKVWPDVRVMEAVHDGLDCIAITDHFKYKLEQVRKKHSEVQGDRNRSFEIARDAARGTGLVVIRGAELTQGMPPGHINAVFLSDANIARPDMLETMKIAREQGAFLFWNHPAWKSPDNKWDQDGIAQWFDVHTELLEAGILSGIEVVNGSTYSSEAHRWALDRNLTMLANSDIHVPIGMEYGPDRQHRPLTLVFATERSEAGIREALFERRTAIWFENSLIGAPAFLAPLFESCIEQGTAAYLENLAIATLHNRCNMDFFVENTGDIDFYNNTRFLELRAGETTSLAIKTGQRLERIDLQFSVRNLHTTPDDVLSTQLLLETGGEIVDKKMLEKLGSN
ncbi:MAG: Sb-PDE family phosphodiesterase [Xanthomonadales bacterium]|nr:Sb-PDE family phosphodiesterase [Xanthomonadales bacterium]